MNNNTSISAYCADLLKRHEPDQHLISLFAEVGDRPGLVALLAFNSEVCRIKGLVSEPVLGQIRLQWWRDTIEALYGGGAVAPSGIAAALGTLIRRRSLPLARFEALLDAREADLLPRPFQKDADLESYLEGGWANLFVLALMALGADAGDSVLRAGREAGMAAGYAEIVKGLGRSAGSTPLLVPLERLEHFGIEPEELESGRRPRELPALVADFIARARNHLRCAHEDGLRPPRRQVAPFLLASLAEGDLAAIEAAGCDPRAALLGRRALSRTLGVWWRSFVGDF